MSIFQDHFSMLSELERLAAMVQDPVRRRELGAEQWPTAMMAFSLLISNDPDRLDEALEVYPFFREKTPLKERLKSLSLLENFTRSRKGEGWRSFLPYALGDEELISLRAAKLTTLMAKPEEGERFTGVRELVRLLQQREDAPKTLLCAAFELADLRVEPLLEPLLDLPAAQLEGLLPASQANRLSCNWMLKLLEHRPELAGLVADSLCAMGQTPQVLDLAMPIPTWAFESPKCQPLHGWTSAEYYARMLPSLQGRLSEDALRRVRDAWGA